MRRLTAPPTAGRMTPGARGQPARASSGGAASRRASSSCTPSAASASPHSRCAARLPSENSAMRAGSSAAALARPPSAAARTVATSACARAGARVSAVRKRHCLQSSAGSGQSNTLRAEQAPLVEALQADVCAPIPASLQQPFQQGRHRPRGPALRALRRGYRGGGARASSAPACTSCRHSIGELRTRLPSAPAALARVLSSPSRSSATSGPTAPRSAPYSAALWKPARARAPHAEWLERPRQCHRWAHAAGGSRTNEGRATGRACGTLHGAARAAA